MNLKKLSRVLNESGYKAVMKSEHCITVNDHEVKIVGSLCIVGDKECPFGGPKDLLLQLWAASIISTREEAVNIADKYLI